jgi:P2-related tail formation protein
MKLLMTMRNPQGRFALVRNAKNGLTFVSIITESWAPEKGGFKSRVITERHKIHDQKFINNLENLIKAGNEDLAWQALSTRYRTKRTKTN